MDVSFQREGGILLDLGVDVDVFLWLSLFADPKASSNLYTERWKDNTISQKLVLYVIGGLYFL